MDLLFLAFNYLVSLYLGTGLDSLFSEFYTAEKAAQPSNEQPRYNSDANLYDFIIVGGGSAGCVVANRLSAHNFSVLLLEAGGTPFPLTLVPFMANKMWGNPNVDWAYRSVPQKYSYKAYINNSLTINRGKGFGGSNMLNLNVYMRGSPYDFDNWAHEAGDDSWRYENLLSTFKSMENYHGLFPNDKWHGTDGPVHVESPDFYPLRDEWIEAGKEIGLTLKDPNGFQSESVFSIVTQTKSGTRFSTDRAYLEPALKRPNLKVIPYAHVQQVIFENGNKAIGVSYVSKGKAYNAFARKEVVLSAGVISSPQILMLSGIGPREHLESLGIPVKVDLPVGKNYRDHFLALVGPFIVDEGKSIMLSRDINNVALRDYLRTGSGPYSIIGAGMGAMLTSSLATNPNWPDIYLSFQPFGFTDPSLTLDLEKIFGFRPTILQEYHRSDIGKDSITIPLCLSTPKSHGELRLASTDPMEHPLIDPNYLSHPDDMKVILEGIQKTLKIVTKTKAFAKIGARLSETPFPGCEQFPDKFSNEYWECHTRHYCNSMWHPVGTCKMGRSFGDPSAVVDSQLRVLGTTGLRVIDASIMPQITTTPVNAPTIMIAEKGAQMILDFWKNQRWANEIPPLRSPLLNNFFPFVPIRPHMVHLVPFPVTHK